jgi:hypothetical protein
MNLYFSHCDNIACFLDFLPLIQLDEPWFESCIPVLHSLSSFLFTEAGFCIVAQVCFLLSFPISLPVVKISGVHYHMQFLYLLQDDYLCLSYCKNLSCNYEDETMSLNNHIINDLMDPEYHPSTDVTVDGTVRNWHIIVYLHFNNRFMCGLIKISSLRKHSRWNIHNFWFWRVGAI